MLAISDGEMFRSRIIALLDLAACRPTKPRAIPNGAQQAPTLETL